MSELKPCPFCGKEPSTYEDTGYVYCPNDDCMAADSYLEKAILPVEKWNTRPIEDALNARIAEFSQAVGLITTLKPTMVMDANHPLDMVREVVEHVTASDVEFAGNKKGEVAPDIDVPF